VLRDSSVFFFFTLFVSTGEAYRVYRYSMMPTQRFGRQSGPHLSDSVNFVQISRQTSKIVTDAGQNPSQTPLKLCQNYAHGPADCRYVMLSLLFSMRKAENRLWLLACTTLGVLGNYRILKEIA